MTTAKTPNTEAALLIVKAAKGRLEELMALFDEAEMYLEQGGPTAALGTLAAMDLRVEEAEALRRTAKILLG